MPNPPRRRLQPRSPLGLIWADWVNGYAVGPERQDKSFEYAESGSVFHIEVDGNTVEARVKGSRAEPYRVVWQFTSVSREQWDLFWSALTPEALREYRKGAPGPAVEAALAVADIHLLPERYKEVKPACSCPDWIRPCKHALAVLRLLGAAIEEDPMLLLRLRGGVPDAPPPEPVPETPTEAGEPLDASRFRIASTNWAQWRGSLLPESAPSRLLKRLGPVSVYGMKMDPDAIFKPVYEGVASEAKQLLESVRRKEKK